MGLDTKLELDLDQVVSSPEVNIRVNDLNNAKVEEYAENFERLPPPKIFIVKEWGTAKLGMTPDGERSPRHDKQEEVESYVLVDGAHRMAAARKLQIIAMEFQVVGEGSLDQAKDIADQANLEHGLNLTFEQKSAIARRVKDRHSDWTERQIAEFLGVALSTTHYWLSSESQANSRVRLTNKMPKSGKALLTFRKLGGEFKRYWSKIEIAQLDDERLVLLRDELKPQANAYADLEAEIDRREQEHVAGVRG